MSSTKQTNSTPSIVLRLGLFALTAVVLLIVALPAEAQAGIRAKWVFNVEFDATLAEPVVASRTIQVLQNGNVIDQWVTDMSDTCYLVGGVSIVGTEAQFDGTGRITCDLPSFRQEVFDETGIFLAETCTIKNDVWSWARAKNLNFSGFPNQPIFNIEDYDITHQLNAIGGGQMTMNLYLDANAYSSSPFTPTSNNNVFGSRIHNCNGASCTMNHVLNGSTLGKSPIAQFAPLTGSSDEITVNIGSDTVNFMNGRLKRGGIDPGCTAGLG